MRKNRDGADLLKAGAPGFHPNSSWQVLNWRKVDKLDMDKNIIHRASNMLRAKQEFSFDMVGEQN